jgi:hypothetical protein
MIISAIHFLHTTKQIDLNDAIMLQFKLPCDFKPVGRHWPPVRALAQPETAQAIHNYNTF